VVTWLERCGKEKAMSALLEGLFEIIILWLAEFVKPVFRRPFAWIRRRFRRFDRKKGDPIRASRSLLFGMTFLMLIAMGILALVVLHRNDTSAWWIDISFLVLAVLSVFIVIVIINIKIFLKTDHLVYRNFLRKKTKIPYRDIRAYSKDHKNLIIRTDTKEYKLDVVMPVVGLDELEELLSFHIENNEGYSRH